MSPSVSACMIIKKEEPAILKRCLTSIKDFVDEIIIIDTARQGNSIDYLKNYGAKISPFTWTHNFAEARNESIARANSDYILWLDADEELAEDAPPLIQTHLAENSGTAVFLTLSYSDATPYEDLSQLRLVPNRPDIRFEGRIHEQLSYSVARAGIGITYCDARIIHHGYADKKGVLSKLTRNLGLLKMAVKEEPENIYLKLMLAKTLIDLDLKDEARKFIQNVISSSRTEDIRRYFRQLLTALENKETIQKGHSKDLLSIVIKSRDEAKTSLCLEAIRRFTTMNYEVLISDNGKYPEIMLKKARGRYVAVLEDSVIVTPYWDIGLVDVFDIDDAIGIVAPVNNVTEGQRVKSSIHFDTLEDVDLEELAEFSRKVRLVYPNLCAEVETVDEGIRVYKKEALHFTGYRTVICGDTYVYKLS